MAGHVDFDREGFGAFKALPREGPIHMLNLIRLRETARYTDGTMVTGREAYAAYSRHSGPIFQAAGGRIIWSGQFEFMLIGPADERWDICFIAEYPSADAFIGMIRNPDYQGKAVPHRTAAVEDSRLVRMSPKEIGAGFG